MTKKKLSYEELEEFTEKFIVAMWDLSLLLVYYLVSMKKIVFKEQYGILSLNTERRFTPLNQTLLIIQKENFGL